MVNVTSLLLHKWLLEIQFSIRYVTQFTDCYQANTHTLPVQNGACLFIILIVSYKSIMVLDFMATSGDIVYETIRINHIKDQFYSAYLFKIHICT